MPPIESGSEGFLRIPATPIAHPVDVRITRLGGSIDRVVELDLVRPRGGEGCLPFVNLGVAVGKGETSGTVVVARGLVDPTAPMGMDMGSFRAFSGAAPGRFPP